MLKKCSLCKFEKDINDFHKDKRRKDGHHSQCKTCIKERSKKYYLKNREKEIEKSKAFNKIYYPKNKDKINNRNKIYAAKNCDKIKKYKQEYGIKNRAKRKKYLLENKKVFSKKHTEYVNNRCKTNINYKISHNLRTRIGHAVKDAVKSDHTLNLLGCSIDFLKGHLQQSAYKNGYADFNINNYEGKKYNIDHIIPCKFFNLVCSYHQKLCFNWGNLQILSVADNLAKRKMDEILHGNEGD